MFLDTDQATRCEKICLSARLDKAAAHRCSESIKELEAGFANVIDGLGEDDTLTVNYNFDIYYFNGVERRLAAFTKLLEDPAIVVNIAAYELEHGECIFARLLDRIREMQAIIKARQS